MAQHYALPTLGSTTCLNYLCLNFCYGQADQELQFLNAIASSLTSDLCSFLSLAKARLLAHRGELIKVPHYREEIPLKLVLYFVCFHPLCESVSSHVLAFTEKKFEPSVVGVGNNNHSFTDSCVNEVDASWEVVTSMVDHLFHKLVQCYKLDQQNEVVNEVEDLLQAFHTCLAVQQKISQYNVKLHTMELDCHNSQTSLQGDEYYVC